MAFVCFYETLSFAPSPSISIEREGMACLTTGTVLTGHIGEGFIKAAFVVTFIYEKILVRTKIEKRAGDSMNKKTILTIFMILSVIGFLTSLYLVKNHYDNPIEGAFCDLSEGVSCSLVNTSIYSELFNVPVALFGALWFVILFFLSWKGMKKDGAVITALLGWNILGILFVVYLVIAEIILQSICPFCTLVHIIVLTTLALSVVLYRREKKKPFWKTVMKDLKGLLIAILIINIIPLAILNFPVSEKVNYDPLAQCITEKDVTMYGSFRCGVCARTRKMFGPSFQYIKEIECHPQGENAQTELCIKKDIEGTPTWIMEQDGEELKRHTGFLSIKELREFSGCTI